MVGAFFRLGATGIANWKNVAFNYTYKFVDGNPQFVSVSDINSYITGIQIAVSWHETLPSYKLTTDVNYRDTSEFTIRGYYLLGVSINGFPLGATINNTWNCSLRLVP